MSDTDEGQRPASGTQSAFQSEGNVFQRGRGADVDGSDSERAQVTGTTAAPATDRSHPIGESGVGHHQRRPTAGVFAGSSAHGTPHDRRLTDIDALSAKRAERQVAGLFLLSTLATFAFVVVFFFWPAEYGEDGFTVPLLGASAWALYTPLLGLLMAVALGSIGAGAVVWAKKLMPDEESVQERHDMASADADRTEAGESLLHGLEETGLARRPLILGSLLASVAALPLLAVVPLLKLGPSIDGAAALRRTPWEGGARLVRSSNGTPIKIGDLPIGGIETVIPEGADKIHDADASVLLIRLRPEEVSPVPGREDFALNGHVAYSALCTHMGCPVKLYQQTTRQLLCPCHQSMFQVDQGATPVFGPAARPLPQLALALDAEDNFIALGDFTDPVGPGFWERG